MARRLTPLAWSLVFGVGISLAFAAVALAPPPQPPKYIITEFCYKGVTYLLNTVGGMSPKMLDASAPFTNSSAARVETCK
jgi:hypothetical protein